MINLKLVTGARGPTLCRVSVCRMKETNSGQVGTAILFPAPVAAPFFFPGRMVSVLVSFRAFASLA